MQRFRRTIPTVVLALGILASTAIVATSPSSWVAFAGVAVLAASIVVARALDRMWATTKKGCWRQALIMAGTSLLLGAVVRAVNPEMLLFLIPMFGAASFAVLSEPLRCFRHREQVADGGGLA